jgi:hypothetical protein
MMAKIKKDGPNWWQSLLINAGSAAASTYLTGLGTGVPDSVSIKFSIAAALSTLLTGGATEQAIEKAKTVAKDAVTKEIINR